MTLLHYTDMDSTFFLKALEMQEGIETLKVFLRLLHIGHPEPCRHRISASARTALK